MSNKIEIEWEVGQEVWCVIFGKGEVIAVEEDNCTDFPIRVRFESGRGAERFTKEGEYFTDCKRSLFFSEPIVTAESLPPKKKFMPVLEPGELVIIMNKTTGKAELVRVIEENEYSVRCLSNDCINVAYKRMFDFYGVGEGIKFNE